MALATKTSFKLTWAIFKDRFFLTVLAIITVTSSLALILNTTHPYTPPYSGPITITGKYIQGYACHVNYTKPDGEKKVYWAGKPGNEICGTIKEGPARLDGHNMAEARD